MQASNIFFRDDLKDAPHDGCKYVRQNGSWTEPDPVTAGNLPEDDERRIAMPLTAKRAAGYDAQDFGAHCNADTVAEWIAPNGSRLHEVNGGQGYDDIEAVRAAYFDVNAAMTIETTTTIDWIAVQRVVLRAGKGEDVQLPPGTYHLNQRLQPHGAHVRLRGAGMDATVLVATRDAQTGLIKTDNGYKPTHGGDRTLSLKLCDLTLRGTLGTSVSGGPDWTESSGSGANNPNLVQIQHVDEVTLERVKVERGRHFGFKVEGARRVRVRDSVFYAIHRDMLAMRECADVLVDGCTFVHSNDDCVTNHVNLDTGAHPGNIKVLNCTMRDTNGIRLLGNSRAMIHGNVMEAFHSHAVYVGYDSSFGEGRASQFGINISHNVFVDRVYPTNPRFGIYIDNMRLPMTGTFPDETMNDNGGWKPGVEPYAIQMSHPLQPDGSDQPSSTTYGSRSIVIAGNHIGRFYPAGAVSNWKNGGQAGYAEAHPLTGASVDSDAILPLGIIRQDGAAGADTACFDTDFAPSSTDLLMDAIYLRGPLFGALVTGNMIDGVLNGIVLDCGHSLDQTRKRPMREVTIARNQITNFLHAGITASNQQTNAIDASESLPADTEVVQLWCEALIEDNLILGDPYIVHSKANADGTFTTAAGYEDLVAIEAEGVNGLALGGNRIGRVIWPLVTGTNSNVVSSIRYTRANFLMGEPRVPPPPPAGEDPEKWWFGGNGDNKGIMRWDRTPLGPNWELVAIASDPSNPKTYGRLIQRGELYDDGSELDFEGNPTSLIAYSGSAATPSNANPSLPLVSGTFYERQFLKANSYAIVNGHVILGWVRLTTGSSHTTSDWQPVYAPGTAA